MVDDTKKEQLDTLKKDGDSIFTKINLHSISKSDCWMRNIPCYNDILNQRYPLLFHTLIVSLDFISALSSKAKRLELVLC